MKSLLCFLLTFFTCLNLNAQNNCLHFDGEDDFVNFTGFSIQNDFTVSFWFKPSAIENFGADDRIIAFGPDLRLELGMGGSDCDPNFGWLYDASAASVFCITINLRDGNWHNLAFVNSNSERSIYLDGDFGGSYSGPPNVTFGSNLRIGRWTGGSNTPTSYSGYVDEVRIWDYALNENEIETTLNCELTGNEEGLLAYWNFNQGEAEEDNTNIDELLDLTSNETHGELRNFSLNGDMSNFVETGAPVDGNCGLTASNDLSETSIVISPNPTDGKFYIEAQNVQNGKLEVLRSDGSLLISQEFTTSSSIDIIDQSPGIYFVRLLSGEEWRTYKIVKL